MSAVPIRNVYIPDDMVSLLCEVVCNLAAHKQTDYAGLSNTDNHPQGLASNLATQDDVNLSESQQRTGSQQPCLAWSCC